jgi:hypothetical protein
MEDRPAPILLGGRHEKIWNGWMEFYHENHPSKKRIFFYDDLGFI